MRTYAVDRRRVCVAGLSAGGAAAAIMGRRIPTSTRPSACIPRWPATRQATCALPPPRCGKERTCCRRPAASSGQPVVPTIVFHADLDGTVHPRNGDQVIAQAATDDGLQTEVMRGRVPGGHASTRTLHRDRDGGYGCCTSSGRSMAPCMLGRAAAPPSPSPIRSARMLRGRGFVVPGACQSEVIASVSAQVHRSRTARSPARVVRPEISRGQRAPRPWPSRQVCSTGSNHRPSGMRPTAGFAPAAGALKPDPRTEPGSSKVCGVPKRAADDPNVRDLHLQAIKGGARPFNPAARERLSGTGARCCRCPGPRVSPSEAASPLQENGSHPE
jgi:hypothetical protein